MNIMDLFRSAPAATPPAPAPGTNNNPSQANQPGQQLPGTQASAQTAPNGVVPTTPEKKEPDAPASPMADFKDIWQTVASDGDSNKGLFEGLDPQKVMESARKVDFAKSLTPEILAKAAAGGEAGVAALVAAMNSVAQTGYAQSAIATTKIVEQALKKQQEKFDAALPNLVKKHSANESILANNPIFSNPAIQPLVGALQEQLVRKNPNATAKEIETQVGDFFQALGAQFAPASKADKAAAGKKGKEEDWSAFLE
jgi:hypothetical protein